MLRFKKLILRLLDKKGSSENTNRPLERIMTKYLDPGVRDIFIIDVGANRGAFYDELAHMFPETCLRALLIEPVPDCLRELHQKYGRSKFVKIYEAVISDKRETRKFYVNQYDETSSLLRIKEDLNELRNIDTGTKSIIEVDTQRLDDLLSDLRLADETINILKIDVQGSEDKVLSGAVKALKRTQFIWIEVSFKKLYEGSCLFSDVHEFLASEGFLLLEITDGHRSPENELLQANCLYKNANGK